MPQRGVLKMLYLGVTISGVRSWSRLTLPGAAGTFYPKRELEPELSHFLGAEATKRFVGPHPCEVGVPSFGVRS